MERKSVLVTGANKGIGFEIARQLAKAGLDVFLGSRDLQKGEAAAAQMAEHVYPVQLDVTDARSIEAARQSVEARVNQLDILINNAGISHVGSPDLSFDEILQSTKISAIDVEELRQMFDVNVFGQVAMIRAMLPLLSKSAAAHIINISSGAGSLASAAHAQNPNRRKFGAYSISKTALTAITLGLAIDLEAENIRVNAACPGFTATDLNNFEGAQTPQDGAAHAVALALDFAGKSTGTLTNAAGTIAW